MTSLANLEGTIVTMESQERRLGDVLVQMLGKPNNFRVADWNRSAAFQDIVWAMHAAEVGVLNMPIPGFNGTCIANSTYLPRYFRMDGRTIYTGAKADAIVLQRGEAAAWASADCPTIVLSNQATRECATIHGARFALLPAHLRPRQTGAVVMQSPHDAITTLLCATDWRPEDLLVLSVLGIGPHYFVHPTGHPTHGARNRAALAHIRKTYGEACTPGPKDEGRIDMQKLVRGICVSLGIPEKNIAHDKVDTYADPGWWSHRRGEEGRNLVLVSNY